MLIQSNISPKFMLSEQHPREQGLKQKWAVRINFEERLSEQHPREQGLKLLPFF